MTSRDVADGVGHGQYGEAERERHAQKADAHLGKASGEHRAAASPKDEPERTEQLREHATLQRHGASFTIPKHPDYAGVRVTGSRPSELGANQCETSLR